MDQEIYPITRAYDQLVFVFRSNNLSGTNPVWKIVAYKRIVTNEVVAYRLGFGDLNDIDGHVYDHLVTNNGDMRKVLSTVVSTMSLFFKEHPTEKVLIQGRDPVRNDYYQKIIRDYYKRIVQEYQVEGFVDGRLCDFRRDTLYESIIVSKRIL